MNTASLCMLTDAQAVEEELLRLGKCDEKAFVDCYLDCNNCLMHKNWQCKMYCAKQLGGSCLDLHSKECVMQPGADLVNCDKTLGLAQQSSVLSFLLVGLAYFAS